MQKNRPEIRFEGFDEAWVGRKLSEFVAYRASHLTASDANDNGNYYLYDANSIIGKTDSEPMKTKYITIIKDGAGVGRIRKMPANTMFIGTMGALIADGSDLGFVFALLTRFNLSQSCSGSTIPHIYFKDYGNNKYFIPQKEEQMVIGQCFEQLDHLIILQQRKYERLQALKKAMLEKMFPKAGSDVPEIRFAGFTDAWEQRKLGALCVEFKSGDFISASDIAENEAYPVYGGNGLRGFTNHYNHDGEYALIGRQGALCGNVNYAVGKSYFTEHAVAVRANKTNQTRFLYYLFSTMNLGQYSGQSAQPGLAVGNLVELENVVPSKPEQEKIASFLSSLDNLITLHQRKLQKLQECKKALLEKMFVG